jgi:uncharacterized protein YdeI (YjbR/CyaY-like superfamily)
MKKKDVAEPARAPKPELPIELFDAPHDWDRWLKSHHAKSPGIWMRIAKKGSGILSTTYEEAVEIALCWGWIDGQKKTYDDTSWIQKFTPRGPRSIWSKINRGKAERLIESGLMNPAGLAAIERAKENGQWDAAYDSARRIEVPDDLQAALDANAEAKAFFATLNRVNRYAVLFRVYTAKRPETRARRIKQLVEMLERNEKIHP